MRTLAKALAILDVFTQRAPSWRLSAIADQTGLDRSTAHRMLKSLVEFGYLSYNRNTKHYALGPTILRLAMTRDAVMPTAEYYRQILADFTADTGESTHASLLAGHQLVTIAICEGLRMNRVVLTDGERLDPHATSSGMACLAWAAPEVLERVLSQPMQAYSDRTLTTPAALLAELETVRRCGYAVAEGTFDAEVFGLAAPIFGHDELSVGAIAVTIPMSRLTADLRPALARATVEAALRATAVEAGRVPAAHTEATRNLFE
jgi:DNA-binding IclR family transcriptional regulator